MHFFRIVLFEINYGITFAPGEKIVFIVVVGSSPAV